ncbi:CheA signal transduction histidine kinase [Desulfamplus magnetovallimortis]|uniref:Chemotaxis protein CheA n=1 Tax=Desulfamplus magnetovallimortis TaxID=1246637 RepID=A0A1W1H5S3_9BACT|nr:chemotaxis protein CheW [Desulfamplus magnetovallimortis]SLM27797.1 CheA signal transduction histidine kinase [Desulfamplus magnetovallimortis]
MIEDDEILQMYIEESLEHLSDIESDLLTIEGEGENIDIDIVNNVFRAAHSIKGGAGFMGLTTIKGLAHSLENVLDLIRNKELVPTPNRISVLLTGFDKLESLMQNIQTSNDEDVSDITDALANITKSTLAEDKQDIITNTVNIILQDGRIFPSVSQYSIEQAKNEGKYTYLVEYDLIKDIHRSNKNPIELLDSLEKTGNIIDSRIDFDSVGTLGDQSASTRIPFQILFASILEPDMASTLFDLADEYIHVVTDEMLAPSNEPAETESIPEAMPTLAAPATTTSAEPPSPSPTETPVTTTQPSRPASEQNPQQAAPKPISEPAHEDVTKPSVPTAPPVAQPQTPTPPPPAQSKTINEKTYQPPPAKKPAPIPQKSDNDSDGDGGTMNISKPMGSLRVNVNLLDTLMNLAGELVLSRNQLIQGINSSNAKATELSSQRIDMITSELQEAIMRTRMQPIANVFNKFTRVVRDLSRELGKSIDLMIEGKEVELDKTIIESINDPLTHLVRNSVDHGIELPQEREAKGKKATGTIALRAFHDAGQVNILISDDGKGLDPEKIAAAAVKKGLMSEQQVSELSSKEKIDLILLPGFSTAEKVTDVSGRGVGMDVVVTNLEKLGGIIEIDSTTGKGTDIQIKLPLTLAIIPSQIISVGNEKYAIPQVNLDELLRIPASQVKERIEKVGDADVVRLRGNLLPLLNLAEVLGIQKTFIHPDDNKEYPDQRKSVADRRSAKYNKDGSEDNNAEVYKDHRSGEDRRYRSSSAINIAVVSAGTHKYGLVVDELRDSEEIVVKPLGRHLKRCSGYAGATIMGDGKVALILDVSNLAQMADLTTMAEAERTAKAARAAEEAREKARDKASLLLFKNGESEHCAAPLHLVERIERIPVSSIEKVSGKKVVQYRGGALPLFELSQVANVSKLPETEQQEIIVFTVKNRELGLMVTPPVDAIELSLDIDDSTLKQTGINGSMIIDGHTTLLVDIFDVVKTLNPSWFEEDAAAVAAAIEDNRQKVILFAEDSAFFRNQVKGFMAEEGYSVITAEDGEIAWNLLKERHHEIDLVVTDLEMPNMDGFELTNKIKSDPTLTHFKVIALTSLASDAHVKKGKEVGIDEYEIKLDRENLMKLIRQYLN